jgi:photosystem II stability/assembly factor-like uncharacterized protein
MDGIAWELGVSSNLLAENYPFLDVVWSPSAGGFVALVQVAANQYSYQSTDGRTWTQLHWTPCLGRLAASDALLINVGTSLTGPCLATSTDGVTWTNQTVPSGMSLRRAFWTGDQFVAVGASGGLATSPDGVAWTPRDTGLTTGLEAVAASGARLVAVGDSGKILTSDDRGATWTPQSSPAVYTLHQVRWTGSEFYAVGEGGTVLRSQDGAQWTRTPASFTESLNDFAWLADQNRLVLVGDDGLTLTSP